MTGIFRPAKARRRLAVLALALLASACSTDDIMRPEADVGQYTASIQAQPGPDDQLVDDDSSRQYQDMSTEEPLAEVPAGQATSDAIYQDPSLDLDSRQSMPSAPRVLPPPAEPELIGRVPEARMAALPRVLEPLTRSEPRQSAYPRLDNPAPQSRSVMSADDVECRRQLKKLGVAYQDIASIRDGGSCFIDNPVKVSKMGSVAIKPAATLTCDMALTFARWTKNELQPAARWRYFSGVKTIRQGSSYSCRRIAGSKTPSAHSQGNALDVMSLELNNGKEIDVTKKGIFSFRERKLLNTVRADGCEYFTTVLGPGYNYDHRNHFHFDLMQRKSGRKACK